MSTYRKTVSGKYEFFVYIGVDYEGNQIKESKTFEKKKDGDKWARDKELERETGVLMEFANMTFRQFIDKWFDDYVDPNLSPTSAERYVSVLYSQALPLLGKIKLKDLQPAHIQTYLTKIKKEGGSENKQKYHYTVLSSALTYANEMNYMYRNPISNVRKPGKYVKNKIEKKKEKAKAMDQEMLKKWFDYTRENDPWLDDYSFIAINTGMCIEEMLGSRWEDINFTKKTVQVEEAKVYVNGRGIVTKGPKSENRYRTIPMSDELAERYRAIWRKQQKIKEVLIDGYTDNNLIIPKKDGNCYTPRSVQWKIEQARKKGNFPNWISSHTFRHTFASLFLSINKNIKALQKIMGHSSYVITSDVYSHFLEKDFEQAGKDISKVVSSIFGEGKIKEENKKNKQTAGFVQDL